ncbi:MAG TPA: hypothetical protein VFD01_08040 [Candidatus Dormibacteraeota bacterium]|jgi:hypothetical protein|nr:hypothetical protein [Candidatus Dormibacteraeota bacterium]
MNTFDRDRRIREGVPPEAPNQQPPNLLGLDLDGLDIEEVEDWLSEGWSEATDGCVVEPDGVCPHGCRSKLLEWGLI